MGRRDSATRQEVYEATSRFLGEEFGVRCLGKLGFENAYAFAMRPDRARALLGPDPQDWTLSKLVEAARGRGLTLATDLQFLARPEWPRVRDTYGLRFAKVKEMDPTLMYPAVKEGEVDVICAYTSDGRIDAYGLELLKDPLNAFPPYDAVLLVSGAGADKPGFVEALRPLLGAIEVGAMRRANYRVDVDHWLPREAARWLRARIERGE
jgi:osmoprotectant transport system permease protein